VLESPEKNLLRAAGIFRQTTEISHCYERETCSGWPYNIYTMIHGRTSGLVWDIRKLSRNTGIKDYQALFTLKELKKTRGAHA